MKNIIDTLDVSHEIINILIEVANKFSFLLFFKISYNKRFLIRLGQNH